MTNHPLPRLVLVDGSGYIFRAYHALPPLTRRDGTPVGAVYGYTTMLLRLRETYKHDRLAVIFDAGRTTFRDAMYAAYKTNRAETPEDLIPQFPLVREATRALNIPAIELENYEADDLIASYAHAARAAGEGVIIVSSDKDLMQLVVDGAVSMFDPMKNRKIEAAQVVEKFGVGPDKVVEVQALIGDAVDNVPGVPGIGPKTAAELILHYGSLEAVLANVEEIKQPKRREMLTLHADAARISRQLVELKCDVPLPVPLEALDTKPFDSAALLAFLDAQNFSTLAKKMGGGDEQNASSTLPSPLRGGIGRGASDSSQINPRPPIQPSPASGEGFTAMPVPTSYHTITDEVTLAQWVAEARREGVVAIDTETTSLDATSATLVGISLALVPGRACYIPVGHGAMVVSGATQSNLFDAPSQATATLLPGQLPLTRVIEMLQPLLIDPSVLKIGHNLKYDMIVLARHGLELSTIADTMLMSYCISGGLNAQGLDFLAEQYFGHKMMTFTDVVGTGKAQKNFSEIDLATATNYAAEDADFTLRLYHALAPKIVASQVVSVYETIERPLVPVIARMEQAGILVNPAVLNELSREFTLKISALEKEIIDLAGMPFAVGSPKQLGEVLFDKLQLPGGKKSAKSGAYTTDAQTLEALAEQGIPIAQKVMEWRQFSKLKSTYTDALPRAIGADGRVHTSYAMAVASTGRLSSSEPNLQNIPIRTEEGKRIREAFVASPGCQLISADYSQIELRLLAEMADIPVLREAFRNGTDIHAVTASQMFGVPVEQVSGELRRRAKTINFGIIYGISAHGLATRLGIDRKEAADYIAKYFAQYPGIREYMDRTIQFAREHGYVKTLYGRRVHVRDIHAKNGAFRQFSERAAINAPLQGTAADIIKRAMIAVDAMLCSSPLAGEVRWGGMQLVNAHNDAPPSNLLPQGGKASGRARILLQVHDELVIEAPRAQAGEVAQAVKRTMEQVANLSIPLTVEVGIGEHWGAIH